MLSWDSMPQSPVFLLLLFCDTSTRQALQLLKFTQPTGLSGLGTRTGDTLWWSHNSGDGCRLEDEHKPTGSQWGAIPLDQHHTGPPAAATHQLLHQEG